MLSAGQPPTCSYTSISSTNFNLTCSLLYADVPYQAINAKMTWTSNGKVIQTDIPERTYNSRAICRSTSVLAVNSADTSTYTCNVTFAKPTISLDTYVAMNAPAFSATCNITGKTLNVIISCKHILLFQYLLKLTRLDNYTIHTTPMLSHCNRQTASLIVDH